MVLEIIANSAVCEQQISSCVMREDELSKSEMRQEKSIKARSELAHFGERGELVDCRVGFALWRVVPNITSSFREANWKKH